MNRASVISFYKKQELKETIEQSMLELQEKGE